MQVPQIKNIRNISTLQITDSFSLGQGQGKQNFRSKSTIGKLMTDLPQQPSSIQTHTYQNKISQTSKQYSVPKFTSTKFQKVNKEYGNYLQERKKFTKPYAECTKFVDSLNKNKALLRRGQFDIPVTNTLNQQSTDNSKYNTLKSQNSQFVRSKIPTIRSTQGFRGTIGQKFQKDSKYDKTLNGHFQSYRKLMDNERWQKKEQIEIKNSMNRILAAEMIEYTLLKSDQKMTKTNSTQLIRK